MVDLNALRSHVAQFSHDWFPNDGSVLKCWFRARDLKFKSQIVYLCEKHFEIIHACKDSGLVDDFYRATSEQGWSVHERVVLAVMLDQMPRNALAIGFGPYHDKDPLHIRENISDQFSLEFANHIRQEDINLYQISSDERVICFFSLIFRHSNDFEAAQNVLHLLRDSEGKLPPLAAKFLAETVKRQQQVTI